MSQPMRIGLDNDVFRDRLRVRSDIKILNRAPIDFQSQRFNAPPPAPTPTPTPTPTTYSSLSKTPVNQISSPISQILNDLPKIDLPVENRVTKKKKFKQWQLMVAASFILVIGLVVTIQTILTNHHVNTQISALSNDVSKGPNDINATFVSTNKPNSTDISQYQVNPEYPRYLKINKIGVMARVLQVGLTGSSAIATPSNVYDTAWYRSSALPGQKGAVLIDGHRSSWTSKGVFHDLNKLKSGDTLSITKGNGQVINYSVIKTAIYSAQNVDMNAAMLPVDSNKAGLNLISCTGQVVKGKNTFNQRIVVFTVQTN